MGGDFRWFWNELLKLTVVLYICTLFQIDIFHHFCFGRKMISFAHARQMHPIFYGGGAQLMQQTTYVKVPIFQRFNSAFSKVVLTLISRDENVKRMKFLVGENVTDL